MPKTLLTAMVTFLLAQASIAQQGDKGASKAAKDRLKFLEEIHIQGASTTSSTASNNTISTSARPQPASAVYTDSASVIEDAMPMQFKYAILLDTEVERLPADNFLAVLDNWMGTRYRLGGSDKSGIDCSALMQNLFQSFYGVSLPRTAREQYSLAEKISRTEMRRGDLLFFNTTGGVSHVGMYLCNNKFIHASSSGGVMISDVFDEYWMRKFIAVGRIDTAKTASNTLRP